MEKAWYWKVVFVLLLVVGATVYLLPTFYGDALPGWTKSILTKRVNLGLDLQGGIHLVLGVEVDKALEDKADQYVRDFKESLKEKRIPFKKVFRIEDTWDIQFELENPDELKKLQKRVLAGYYNLKETEADEPGPATLRMTFDEKYVDELRRNARDQARVTVRNRVDEFGVSEPTIAPHGETGILVQLPGMFEPERAKKLLGRTAQLEFKMVDDKSDTIKRLKDRLPDDIKLEYYTYSGPNDEPVTEAFLLARGKSTAGRNRLIDFFANTPEVEQFFKEKSVDAKAAESIVAKVRGGLTAAERKEVLDLARGLFPAGEGGADSPDMAELERLLRGKVPDGREIGYGRTERQLEVEYRTYLLESDVAMTGDYITDAMVRPDPETGQPEVSLNFDRTGAVMFEKLTGANVKRRMAIVLEGEVSSAPVIQGRIAGGRARITLGSMQNYNEALTEAQDLATVLRAGAMPAPVRILEERTVGPTMGEDARRQGTYALAIGLILVVIFMVLYYKVSGLIADVALILNALFLMAVMAAFGATLTLPGIAGIVLTLGMAVDANVIINERVREELRAGKTVRAAVDAGYSRAFWTIFDANFTTLIAAVVLWSYGSGPIQGFAVTLFIGIIVSMFTAIFVTRIIIDWLTMRKKLERLSI